MKGLMVKSNLKAHVFEHNLKVKVRSRSAKSAKSSHL